MARRTSIATQTVASSSEETVGDGESLQIGLDRLASVAAQVGVEDAGMLCDALIETAVLLVSELVTNAIRHAGGPCALVVSLDDHVVEFSVQDGTSQLPMPRRDEHLGEDGRGLLLIEALAEEWGVRQLPAGKATWFVLRTPPTP